MTQYELYSTRKLLVKTTVRYVLNFQRVQLVLLGVSTFYSDFSSTRKVALEIITHVFVWHLYASVFHSCDSEMLVISKWFSIRMNVMFVIYFLYLSGSSLTIGLREKPETKKRRKRTIFTTDQLKRLEAAFEQQQYLVGTERERLARDLRLSETQVKIWFQNRRIKWRKEHLYAVNGSDHIPDRHWSGSVLERKNRFWWCLLIFIDSLKVIIVNT